MRDFTITWDFGSVELDVIEDFAAKMGVSLPVVYKDLLSKHNGLSVKEEMFPFISPVGNDMRDCCFLAHGGSYDFVAYGSPYVSDTVSNAQLDPEDGHDNIVIFARCANGDKIGFDYRTNPTTDNPPVVVVFHDWWEEGADGVQRMLVCDVAKDFECFVDLLHSSDDE